MILLIAAVRKVVFKAKDALQLSAAGGFNKTTGPAGGAYDSLVGCWKEASAAAVRPLQC